MTKFLFAAGSRDQLGQHTSPLQATIAVGCNIKRERKTNDPHFGNIGKPATRFLQHALLRTAKDLMPEGAELIEGSIAGIPLYDADDEQASGLPAAVEKLKTQIADADGVLLFTPEYNNSIPGVFKNAIDWTSRPANDIGRVFGGKRVAVLGASPGGFGTILAQDA